MSTKIKINVTTVAELVEVLLTLPQEAVPCVDVMSTISQIRSYSTFLQASNQPGGEPTLKVVLA